ncbi:1,4-dihydroxy-2-naphthoate octaprenyltransferase [Sinobacterium norvegicum]|uniref:1,4-dihydroxy-2-naphthoate octaprenyltransferase n=1 Tax=Sinobacterium norvegicum TaxID=1641715 RepID=A0ABM9AER8_9GAMM|nr:1,4-dihydroxy-2-naphthoate polyprenyltransferase [Sinobacterium norvegicum]CAH0991693.1 1,4-dihydroxy-2-naphthoate octaprenyltransferase [Sinobacterium norvegicum]
MAINKTVKAWFEAARPKTLPLALASILTGSSLAAWQQQFSWPLAAGALVTAMLLQILSNLANDYGDAIKGTDNDNRLGPDRAIQSGSISPKAMLQAIAVTVALTLSSGIALIIFAFNNTADILGFLALGVIAIVAAITYTVGNKPYGYRGLGDLSVLIFFGWLSVSGGYYLYTGDFLWLSLLPATAAGLLAVGVLNINNLRDIDNDRDSGKFTLVVRMGGGWARRYHLVLLATSFLCLIAFSYLAGLPPLGWLFLLALIPAALHAKAVHTSQQPQEIAPMMSHIVGIALLTNVLFSIGLIIG